MRIAVVGDLLLDVDVSGTSVRNSPDPPGPRGPAPVVDAVEHAFRAGGAGLVATLLSRDGHEVRLVSAIGSDETAARLTAALPAQVHRVLGRTGAPTPVKLRVRVDDCTWMRIDAACAPPPPPVVDSEVAEALTGVDGIVVADYGRGLLASPVLRNALARAAEEAPVVWDPHPRGAVPTTGTIAVTPNLSEAVGFTRAFAPDVAAELDAAPSTRRVAHAARLLRAKWGSRAVAVTRGERGLVLCAAAGPRHTTHEIAAQATEAPDVCGAGDRLVASVGAALAAGVPLVAAFETATRMTSEFLRCGGVASLAPQPRIRGKEIIA